MKVIKIYCTRLGNQTYIYSVKFIYIGTANKKNGLSSFKSDELHF